MNELFSQCPACGGPIVITGCKCSHCNLQMQGEFLAPRLSALSAEQLAFIQVFLKARGNLTETERILGVSYPTIRNKLDEINRVLERIVGETSPAGEEQNPADGRSLSAEEIRRNILQRVSEGSISAEEGTLKLQNLAGDDK